VSTEDEFMKWAYWSQINDIVEDELGVNEAIVEKDSKQKWICGHCGWITNDGQQATIHMWGCAQVRLIGN
jgi:hypothetical protein